MGRTLEKLVKFTFLTLFPDTIHSWLNSSIIGRARAAGLFEYEAIQLRDFATGPHKTVDDIAYGGGGGMVLKVEPLVAAIEAIKARSTGLPPRVLAFSAAGRLMNQNLFHEARLSPPADHFILICGHYEGIDQRVIDHWVDLELSLGDFVVTGGELPALVFADAMIRGIDGSLGHPEGYRAESFQLEDPQTGEKLLEYPHYTRPTQFRSLPVPPVLTSGNHKAIAAWRLDQSRQKTTQHRPKGILSESFDKPLTRSDTQNHG